MFSSFYLCRSVFLPFSVSFFVVCSWLLIFQTHFKDQFVPNAKDEDLSQLLEKNKKIDDSDDNNGNHNNDNNNNSNNINDNENDEYNSMINGLSFDMDEETFLGADGNISQKNTNNSEILKKRKQTNPSNNSPLKNNNPFSGSNNKNENNNNEINEIRRDLMNEKLKIQIQMSEGSSILKIEQIELLVSWLPSKQIK